jgi:hypothetical protein
MGSRSRVYVEFSAEFLQDAKCRVMCLDIEYCNVVQDSINSRRIDSNPEIDIVSNLKTLEECCEVLIPRLELHPHVFHKDIKMCKRIEIDIRRRITDAESGTFFTHLIVLFVERCMFPGSILPKYQEWDRDQSPNLDSPDERRTRVVLMHTGRSSSLTFQGM